MRALAARRYAGAPGAHDVGMAAASGRRRGSRSRARWCAVRTRGSEPLRARDPVSSRPATRRSRRGSAPRRTGERSAAGLVPGLVSPAPRPRWPARPASMPRTASVPDPDRCERRGGRRHPRAAWHAKGFTGKGVKVAVIDGGFEALPTDRRRRPPRERRHAGLLRRQLATGEDHGTAVAEIVHEMAPDAQLYLVCVDTEVDLAAAVAYAKSQGVTSSTTRPAGSGPAETTAPARSARSSPTRARAGSCGSTRRATTRDTHWAGTFINADGDRWHDVEPERRRREHVRLARRLRDLRLSEMGRVARRRLRLRPRPVPRRLGTVIAAPRTSRAGGAAAVEGLCVGSRAVAISLSSGPSGLRRASSPRLDLVSWSPPLQYQTAAGSIGDAGLVAGRVRGRRPLLAVAGSSATAPRARRSTAGRSRTSPVTTASRERPSAAFSSCPSGFAGTSASSPEVAGAAALVKQAYPSSPLTSSRRTLVKAAREIGACRRRQRVRRRRAPDAEAARHRQAVGEGNGQHGPPGGRWSSCSQGSDDSGDARIVEKIKLGRRTIATHQARWDSCPRRPRRRSQTLWKAPKNGSRARISTACSVTDRTGNASPLKLREGSSSSNESDTSGWPNGHPP